MSGIVQGYNDTSKLIQKRKINKFLTGLSLMKEVETRGKFTVSLLSGS